MVDPQGWTVMLETNREARLAALGATRQMIADDSFEALCGVLIETGAVPRDIMSATLDELARAMIAKAKGQMETDIQCYPATLFDRARRLSELSGFLRMPRS